MGAYLPLAVMVLLATSFVVGSIFISLHLGPRRYNRAKLDSFECGVQPTPPPPGGGRFHVKYYVSAMLFIVFDIEIVFLYPWAVALGQLGVFAVIEMALFMLTVFIVYLYVYRRGGLDWS
ncbi:MAG: NADH-quinone oxidoreductase subunit A [Propionibacteriaceae bacterium]|jgi:NADH-quinone oxidoreductase subunit A|nr:NADH-quinone oxidoreductase subunit A [Propionibacteriaceae bacterium]